MYIAIAGNIGSGKTTLTNLLVKNYGYTPVFEQSEDNPYLVNFYNDMRRWAFNLQVYFLQNRYSHLIGALKEYKDIVQDRTIYEDAYIFAPTLHNMGLLSAVDYETYISLFNLLNSLTPAPDLLVYLKASVPTLISLITKRGRIYENTIRLDYINSLNKRYDDWIEGYQGKKIVIDVDNLNIIDNPKDLGVVFDKISAEINPLFK
jgi:deoxyadenosine/deoxycytidine kinase